MKNKILSFLFMVVTAFSTTSCLEDEYLFDYDNMTPVIELPYVNHYLNLSYKAGSTSVSSKLYVNYSIADWRNIDEDIPVTLDIDQSLLSGAELLPASAYNLTFPLTMTIKKASDIDPTDRDKLNNQSATEILNINLTDPALESGKKYGLPVRIVNAPSDYVISGNFNTMVFYVTIQ
ncbi:MAG: DUF1735 domain-containing protein [Bacteroides sp.]|nr:DUF1735 domain-containing protein [Bacteroides sp.]